MWTIGPWDGEVAVNDKRSLIIFTCVALLLLAVTVPLQYLVRKEVKVGLETSGAHAHAHEEEGGRGVEEEEEEGHEHTHEENHLGSEVKLGVNLIANYGFEVGTREQIWGWGRAGKEQGAVIYRDEGTAYKGFSSAAVDTNGIFAVDAGWYMKMRQLPRNHDVIFKGYVKSQGLTGSAYLRVMAQTVAEGQEKPHLVVSTSSDEVNGDSGWTLSSLRCFIPPEATAVWLEVGVCGKGKAWFDELSLVVEEREDEPLMEENLLRNPSLENGARYWHYDSDKPNPLIVYENSPSGPGGSTAFLFQDMTPLSTQEQYSTLYQPLCGFYGHRGTLTVTGWLRARNLNGTGSAMADVFSLTGVKSYKSKATVSGDSEWTPFSLEIPIGGDAGSVWVRINIEGWGGLYVSGLKATFHEEQAQGP